MLSAHTVASGDPGLVVLDVEHFPIERQWHIVRRRDRDLPLVPLAFLDYVRDEGARLLQAGTGKRAKRRRRAG